MLEPGALVCELYHLIFDAIFLSIPQFYIKMKIFSVAKPVLVLPVPAIVGVFESIWSDVKLVGFCVTYLWSGCILCFRNITAFLSTMKVRR